MITPDKLFTLGMITNKINSTYPELKFWDGISAHESFNPQKSYKHRQGMPNEIRIEFDHEDRNKNWQAIMDTAYNLWQAGYSFAIFSVEGGRSPHIHIYDIDEMDNLTLDKRTEYRKLFLRKFCPVGENPDFGLCDEKHLCALEFAPHFKYGKPKALLHYFWQGKNQGCEFELKFKAIDVTETAMAQAEIKDYRGTNEKLKYIMTTLGTTFEKIFEKYKVKHKGHMALCPFHMDKDMSLSFSDEKGLWKCFGCEAKGDLITLKKMLMELKNEK